ncbi:hypothetical protein LguiA_027444 [Lonicera macranthoides]
MENLGRSEMKEGGKKIPAFFKKIPLDFALHVKGLLPEKAYLRDINENLWPMEVIKSGDKWFFEDGWVEFVKTNGVEEGDFLVFQFNGKFIFDFKLLGKTACEKLPREAFDFRKKGEKVVEEERENIQHEEVERLDEEEHMRNGDYDVMDDEEENDGDHNDLVDDEEENDGDHNDLVVVEKEEHVEEEEGDFDNDDDCDDDYEMEEEVGVRRGKKIKRSEANNSCAGLIEFGRTNNSVGKTIVKVCNECRRPEFPIEKYDDDDLDIFKSGQIVRPDNPFFVAKIRRSRRSELYVPLDVIKDHNIKLGKEIYLCDPNGKKWIAHVCTWKDGRTWLTRGWKRLCKWNYVKEEDSQSSRTRTTSVKYSSKLNAFGELKAHNKVKAIGLLICIEEASAKAVE